MQRPPSIEGSLPPPEDMRVAIAIILEKCASYQGPHEDYVRDLEARLKEDFAPVAKQGLIEGQDLEAKYLGAISSLLSLALPAGTAELDNTLGRINSLIERGQSFSNVDFLEGSSDGPELLSLRDTLGASRALDEDDRATVFMFAMQMPRSDWGRIRRRQQEGDESV